MIHGRGRFDYFISSSSSSSTSNSNSSSSSSSSNSSISANTITAATIPLTPSPPSAAIYESYEGDYRRGLRHGRGTYTYVNGTKYVGEIIDR